MAPRSPPQTRMAFKVELARFGASEICSLFAVSIRSTRSLYLMFTQRKSSERHRQPAEEVVELFACRVLRCYGESDGAGRSTDGWMTAPFRIGRQ